MYLTFSVANYLQAIRENADNARPHYMKDGQRVFFRNHKELDAYYKYVVCCA